MTVSNRWNRMLYRLYAPIYDLLARPFEDGRRRAIERLDLTEDDRVLILGCGTGADLPHLPDGADVTAVDITPAMVEKTERRAARLDRAGTVDARVGDAQDLPFDDGSFDAVLLHLVLSVAPEPERVVAETDRVLAEEGRASVFDKFLRPGEAPGLLRRVLNPVARRLFSDLNRRLEPMLAGTGLRIAEREWLLGGLYCVATLERDRRAE